MSETIAKVRRAALALLPPIFSKCVHDDLDRAVAAPFIERIDDVDWIISTNGQLLARIPLEPGSLAVALRAIIGLIPYGTATRAKPPRVADLYHRIAWAEEPVEWPPLPGAAPCYNCDRKRVVWDFEDDRIAFCPDCEGSGYVLDRYRRVTLAPGIDIALEHAWTLYEINASLYLGVNDQGMAIPNTIVKWIAGTVTGVLMPMRYPPEN